MKNGNQDPTASGFIASQSWLMWAVMLSAGKLQYAGVAATGGLTAEQVRDTHLPTAVAAKPDACIVSCGINNLPTLSMTSLASTMTTIYETLRGAGIQPVACLLTPHATYPTQVAQVNAWISRYSAAHNMPCLDFHTPGIDETNGHWQSAYTSDTTHPNGAGAALLGQKIVDQLVPHLAPTTIPLSQFSTDTNNIVNPSNALFLTDTNADGIPDGVSVQGTDGTQTPSIVADSAIPGSWFRINKTSGTGNSIYKTAAGPAASNGDRILVCGRINLVTTTPGTTAAIVGLVSNVKTYLPEFKWDTVVNGPFMMPVYTLDSDVTRLQVYMYAAGGTIDVRYAQITVLNLTAMGISV